MDWCIVLVEMPLTRFEVFHSVAFFYDKMGVKTVPHPPYSPDLASCDFCLFSKLKEKLRGCCYETIEEM